MAHDTAAGATFSVSATAPATFDQVGFEALTFTAVGEVTTIGEFGREYNLTTHLPLSSRAAKKAKGSYNNGQISPAVALDNDDAGQTILETALSSDDPVSIKIELDGGDVYYMSGLVMSFKPSVGSVDDTLTKTPVIEIDHNPIVLVNAA